MSYNTIAYRLLALGIRPSQALTELELAHLERLCGCNLPLGFKSLLTHVGGVLFDGTICYREQKTGVPVALGEIYGSVERFREALDDNGESLPDGLLPFGDDGADNLYCIGVSRRDHGKVYFHDHSVGWHFDALEFERRGEPLPPDFKYRTVELLAPTLESFVEGLFRNPEFG